MKIWIVHDSKTGNGKKLAETLGKSFGTDATINIGHVKEVDPVTVVNESPDLIVIGAAIRAFMVGSATKKWVRTLKSKLKKDNKKIKFGVTFVTHAMKQKTVNSLWAKGFQKEVAKGNLITNVYQEWLSGRVVAQAGPFEDGTLEKIANEGKEILAWMKS